MKAIKLLQEKFPRLLDFSLTFLPYNTIRPEATKRYLSFFGYNNNNSITEQYTRRHSI